MRKADFDKLVARLQGLSQEGAEEVSDDTIVQAFQTDGQPVYQLVYDRGHGAATGRKSTEVERLTTERDNAIRERDEAQAKLSEIEGSAPDAEKIREQYNAELEKAKLKAKETEEALKARLHKERVARARADLRTTLVSKHSIDPDYAEVLASRPDIEERFSFTDDGDVEVLQRGKQIPYAPGDGQTSVGLLAAELREGVNPKFVLSGADNGSGANGNGGGGSGNGGGFDYKKHREKHEARQKESDDSPSAKERMGLK